MKDGQGMALLGEPTRQSQGKTGSSNELRAVLYAVPGFLLTQLHQRSCI